MLTTPFIEKKLVVQCGKVPWIVDCLLKDTHFSLIKILIPLRRGNIDEAVTHIQRGSFTRVEPEIGKSQCLT